MNTTARVIGLIAVAELVVMRWIKMIAETKTTEMKQYWRELKKELDEIRKEQDYWNMKFRRTQEELWRIEELLCIDDEGDYNE